MHISVATIPSKAMTPIATSAPNQCAIIPVCNIPKGPKPIHTTTKPITRLRISGAVAVKVMVACIELNPASPKPPTNNMIRARLYQGAIEKRMIVTSNASVPPRKKRIKYLEFVNIVSSNKFISAPAPIIDDNKPTETGPSSNLLAPMTGIIEIKE
jgi:hypothetical protein